MPKMRLTRGLQRVRTDSCVVDEVTQNGQSERHLRWRLQCCVKHGEWSRCRCTLVRHAAVLQGGAPSALLVNLSFCCVIMRFSSALAACRKGVMPHSISYSKMPTLHQSTAYVDEGTDLSVAQ